MTQTIEQLTARVRELEEELDAAYKAVDDNWVSHQQLVASQAYAEQLREALELLNKVSNIGCDRVEKALALPSDTSALDAYVAESVKEATEKLHYRMEHCYSIDGMKAILDLDEMTRQRDLAVEALKAIAGRRIFIDNLASNVDIAVMTLDVIKESEAMAQAEHPE